MLGVMAGWVTSPLHGMHNTIIALAGVCTLLLVGVLTWDDLLSEKKAWDALIWFAPLLMMADALNESGVIKVLSTTLFAHLQGWSWGLALCGLALTASIAGGLRAALATRYAAAPAFRRGPKSAVPMRT